MIKKGNKKDILVWIKGYIDMVLISFKNLRYGKIFLSNIKVYT